MKKIFAIILCAAAVLLAASCNKDTVKEGDFVTYEIIGQSLSGSTFDLLEIEGIRIAMTTAMVFSIGYGDDGVYTYTPNLDEQAKSACDAVYTKYKVSFSGEREQTLVLQRKNLGDKPATITLATYVFTPVAK